MKVRDIFVTKKMVNAAKAEQAKNEDYKEKYTYLLAEFENYKKRMVKDKEFLKNDAIISTIEPFLQINDFLGMAKIACEKSDNLESIKYGLNMIFDKFYETLSNMNIKKIKSIGNKFDPNLHNAIEYKHSDDVQEGFIIAEIKSGYLYGDKVIHPSDVIVSSGNE
jgi:molecular chaperone GrpE